jgi:hypothetical protein
MTRREPRLTSAAVRDEPPVVDPAEADLRPHGRNAAGAKVGVQEGLAGGVRVYVL